MLASIFKSPPQRIAGAVAFAGLAGVGFVPLFGGPGYESSVASGLVVPSAAAIATALELSGGPRVASASPLACVARGLLSGVLLAGIAFAVAFLHGLRVGLCDLWGGGLFFALTAGFGSLLGGVWGAVVAEICRGQKWRRLACVVMALAAPLSGIAFSVARFYTSPIIFAYDPFFGFFSGALYDTVVDVRVPLWTYRAGSTATLLGVVFMASALRRNGSGRTILPFWHLSRREYSAVAFAIFALAASLAVSVEGAALGHWQTASTIASSLGGHASGPRCDVVFPESLLPDQVALLVRDCEQELASDEERLGAHLRGRLLAFEFADADEKRRLMGAADTSIAKPWRREVYVQLAGYPHPILGHEIAHVVAGSFAAGPFHVAGGLLPNPGLIEGIAVATSPDDDPLTNAEWARAMLDLGILPPLREVFSLDFFGQNASKSYTVAGAFVAWVLDRWGPGTVRSWYGGSSLEALTGQRWDALDQAFRGSLRGLPMPPQASVYARAKFDRPSVWARRCPHAVDALNRAADQCRDDHRFDRAIELYESAISRDSKDWHARFDRAWVILHFRDEDSGRADMSRIAEDEGVPRTWRDRADEAMADDDLGHGRVEPARVAYRAIASRTLDEDVARTLEVKALAGVDESGREAVVDLLIGSLGRPVDPWLGAFSIGTWGGDGATPLAAYLAGKNLALHDAFPRAARWLDRALAAPSLPPIVARELYRARVICACVLEDRQTLARLSRQVDADDSPFAGGSTGRRAWLVRLIERCTPTTP